MVYVNLGSEGSKSRTLCIFRSGQVSETMIPIPQALLAKRVMWEMRLDLANTRRQRLHERRQLLPALRAEAGLGFDARQNLPAGVVTPSSMALSGLGLEGMEA